ncbi:OTU (ovarian tumor)-like cysteine protease [Plasmopara halstedii]|uniref:OTU (Ovarian tumor)-like cysteine protease n=1 Tax=Plasmopara halstedii TaxID=4781 RepID=A0A0N7L4H6_PLAHL|nr:OTU (ovarian tumor)-like cysteine protease [Plasmopara halstedii]CEG38699.1 OTU (ovarian tumor)-like cysteine protease [Plasmopara halstedii]|eukprot:XP_024575068.1 OTU (ovarian tumor)-like cysteine protease [Plasmopara halstedii]
METLGQVKQRHKLEMRTLQNEIKLFQKKAKKERMGKKEIEEKILSMEIAVKERQDQELEGYEAEMAKDASPSAAPDFELAELSKQAKTQAKAQRKREAKKKQDRERREFIEEANKKTVSQRQIEANMILAQLAKYGLKIKEIPSDGHCMYHAVADQIQQKRLNIADGLAGYQHLRTLTSEYMLAHSEDFLPFMALDDSFASPEDAFATYCDQLVNTAVWGGQLELRALACALRAPIEVFSAEGDVLLMGEHFNSVTPA